MEWRLASLVHGKMLQSEAGPSFRALCKGWESTDLNVHPSQRYRIRTRRMLNMPRSLHRCYGLGYLHYITFGCYQRRPFLNTPQRRTLFLEILEQVRQRYNFVVVGYMVMPNHIHLMISEPERGNPSTAMQVLKQRFARHVLQEG